MMNEIEIRKELSDLSLGRLRFFEQTTSTNDVALAWATEGAPNLSLVYAEEQTAGRGRGNHRWQTPAGTGLAFSLILRPVPVETISIQMFSALGALAVCEALGALGMEAQIKWPNDVLLNRRKVCGVLAESVWVGDKVENIVIGIGVNVMKEAVPAPETVNFPATCLETESGKIHNRARLLREILQALLYWRNQAINPIYLITLENRLAFRGEQVLVRQQDSEDVSGALDGLEKDGSLRLLAAQGKVFTVRNGEVHLSPVV